MKEESESTVKLTETDLRNLDAVFNYARRSVVDNEQELLELISFRRSLMEKLAQLTGK